MAQCNYCGSEFEGLHDSCIPAMAKRIHLLEKAIELLAEDVFRSECGKDLRNVPELKELSCGNWQKFERLVNEKYSD